MNKIKLTLFLLAFIAIVSFLFYKSIEPYMPQAEAEPTPTPPTHLDAYKIYNLVNDYRASKGLNKLVFDPALCPLAEERLGQVKSDWSHDQLKTTRNKYFSYGTVGENLARDHTTENQAVNGWIASPTHLDNIEKSIYTNTCIATDANYALQIFSNF